MEGEMSFGTRLKERREALKSCTAIISRISAAVLACLEAIVAIATNASILFAFSHIPVSFYMLSSI
jgi:hypothetical protein